MAQTTLTPDRTPQGWGSVAGAYDDHISPFTGLYARSALEATKLRPGERVLDVAAGSGALSLQASQMGARVVGTDFAPEMIERLKERAREAGVEVDARVMDGQDLRLEDGTFDAVFSIFGLMFFPQPDKGLAEMRRVLKEGGRAGIVVWNVPERSEMFQTFMTAMKEAVPDMPPPPQPPAVFSLADADELSARMQLAGFKDVNVRQVAHPMTGGSPEELWDAITRSNPVMPGLLANVGPENAEKVREAFIRRAAQKVRDGRVTLTNEAHLLVGHA